MGRDSQNKGPGDTNCPATKVPSCSGAVVQLLNCSYGVVVLVELGYSCCGVFMVQLCSEAAV